jgi:alpha-beta hydrolase superfamily lysophospholipase
MSDARSPRIHLYSDREFMLSYGPNDGPQLLVLQPLFEEMNRCRATIAGICRELGTRGIGCWLPDLPGTGESLRALHDVAWADWRSAVDAAAATIREQTGVPPATVAIRGGALLDDAVAGRAWRLAPTTGRSLLSDLRRSALASGSDPAHPAGYTLSPALADALATSEPASGGDVRTVRLASDERPADQRIDGSPIWRRPEPVTDSLLEHCLVEEIVAWAKL